MSSNDELEAPAEPVAWEVAEAALHRSWGEQIDKLARFILNEVPGEPAQSEGAVDTAIRWMRAKLAVPAAEPAPPARQDALREALEALQGFNLKPNMVVGAQADFLTLRVPVAAIQKAAAAVAKLDAALAAVPATEVREVE